MTKQEVKARKWIKNIRDDAIVTLDHITKKEPNVNHLVYENRKARAEIILNNFEELEQYRAIGTVEECREAREKQISKMPNIEGDGYDDAGNIVCDTWICPNCGTYYEIDYDEYNYCPKCGQHIERVWEDWSEKE